MQKKEELGKERLAWMYAQMVRIREFEEAVKRAFIEHPGAIRGHAHLGDGAEASIVGALSTRNSTDLAMPSYRCHGYPIVLGTPMRRMMAEMFGRKDGLCRRAAQNALAGANQPVVQLDGAAVVKFTTRQKDRRSPPGYAPRAQRKRSRSSCVKRAAA